MSYDLIREPTNGKLAQKPSDLQGLNQAQAAAMGLALKGLNQALGLAMALVSRGLNLDALLWKHFLEKIILRKNTDFPMMI